MAWKKHRTAWKERDGIDSNLAAILVVAAFLSAIAVAALLVFAEKTPIGFPLNWSAGIIRVPLGLYVLLFPTGFLLYSVLFGLKKIDPIKILGYSIALSISVITLSVLLANMLFGFPITLARNLGIALALNVLFFALFFFKERIAPEIEGFFEEAERYYSKREESLLQQQIHNLFFVSLIAFGVLAYASLTLPDTTFHGIAEKLSLIAIPLLTLLPFGYFVVCAFFSKAFDEREPKTIAVIVGLSLLSLAVAYVLLFIGNIVAMVRITIFRVFLLQFVFSTALYLLYVFKKNVLPFVLLLIERKPGARHRR